MSDALPLYMKLFERCEEMRPKKQHADLCGQIVFIPKHLSHGKWVPERYVWKFVGHEKLQRIYPQEALALCRCAVEDWLRKLHELRLSDNTEVSIEVDDYRPREGRVWVWKSYNGPTIHHALIAAANAVRDAQGVAG
jgi:hypothetical protein